MEGKYWDRAWSLVDGCTPCSPGCDHCWAARMAHRFARCKGIRNGEPIITTTGGKFKGVVIPRPDHLSIPLKRRKPTVWAVWNDLFHEAVPDEFIDAALETMISRPDHIFLVLTKRPHRIAAFFAPLPGSRFSGHYQSTSNVYHGLSVCNQQEADEKIPVFLQVPGKKFLSIEPMLGAIDLSRWLFHKGHSPLGGGCLADECAPGCHYRKINAVLLGGETGPGARPMHPDWVRSVRDQCAAAGVDFFFKGWGTRKCNCYLSLKNADRLNHGRTGVTYECPIHDWGQESGRLLDGRTHDDLPWREKGDDEK